MSLKLLVQLLDDEPGCGTMPPRHPPHPHPHADPAAASTTAVPSYATRLLIAAAHDAVRLYQFGNVGGELQETLHQAANKLFDDTCGSVPLSELLQLLHQHWPPPPPSPGVRFVEHLVSIHVLNLAAARWHKIDAPTAYSKTIEELIQDSLLHRIDVSGPGAPHKNNVSIHLPIPVPPRPIGGVLERG